MYAILFRTLFLYVLITVVIRAMGKRQVGELEMSELVTTLLLSQLASLPIEDPEIPILYVVIPVLFIVSIEIVITFGKSRVNFLKRIFEGKPSILVDCGRIDQAEMGRMRITVGELLSAVRQQGYRTLDDIYYAILEENGKFSLIPKTGKEPFTAEDAGILRAEAGCALPLISDGVIDEENMRRFKKNRLWLEEICKKKGTTPEEVFLLTLDEAGNTFFTLREGKK